MQDQPKPSDKIMVTRSQMVDEILGKLGAQGTKLFWELLCEMRNEDSSDAETLRTVREAYLRGGEMNLGDVSAAVILALVRSWESDPSTPVLNAFYNSLREYTVFKIALKCAEYPWTDQSARRKVIDAVTLLRELFEGKLMRLNVSDIVN
jgi:hypothetical protein